VFTEFGPYASEIIRGASETALARGGRVTVNALSDEKSERAWIDHLERGGADGVILAMADLAESTSLRLRNLATPVVVVDPVGDPPPSINSVGVTNWIGGMRAAEHLIELGHRRIGLVGGRTRKLCNQARLDGYRAALEHAGLPIDPALIAVDNPDHASALAAARRTTNLRLVAFHFFFDVVGELFDFFRFFQDVQGKHVFIRLVDLVLELLRQLQQAIRVTFKGFVALSVGLLRHVFFHSNGAFVFRRPLLRGRRARTILRTSGRRCDNDERQYKYADKPLQT